MATEPFSQSLMPRITRRPRPPVVTTDPETMGNSLSGASLDEIMQAVMTAVLTPSGALNPQKIIELAEQTFPPGMIAEILDLSLSLVKAERDGTPTPPEASLLFQSLASAAFAPNSFKQLRTKLGISQQELANVCNVERTSIIRWEQGESPLPPQAIQALLKITVDKSAKIEPLLTGSQIVWLRNKLELSQRDFAKKVGVSPLTIFNWEKRGDRPLPRSASNKVREHCATELSAY